MNIKEAEENVGGLSSPSKMPTCGWSISAFDCRVGSVLATREGSACFRCYARKGRYVFPKVQNALRRRLQKWHADRVMWRASMVYLMHHKKAIVKSGCFRWFDSGDLQNVQMLSDIVYVALETPQIRHWLPTKEYKLIREFQSNIYFPKPTNLIIRVSHPYTDKVFVNGPRHNSVIFNADRFADGFDKIDDDIDYGSYSFCPSSFQKNSCGECRACWDSKIETIVYKAH
jgi:hypothetical protein